MQVASSGVEVMTGLTHHSSRARTRANEKENGRMSSEWSHSSGNNFLTGVRYSTSTTAAFNGNLTAKYIRCHSNEPWRDDTASTSM